MNFTSLPQSAELPAKLVELITETAAAMAAQPATTVQSPRVGVRRRGGRTLRPGPETPLWNELRAQLRPHLLRRGEQARVARLLGLPRQRVNAFVTGGGTMPDAERTLQLIAWLVAVRHGAAPA